MPDLRMIPWALLGFNLSGDIDGLSIYTDARRRKIVYPKSPPNTPPSPAQVHQRARFRTAQQLWKNLSAAEHEALEDACRAASLVMGGCALFISACLTNSNDNLQTLAAQVGIPLPNAPYVP